MFGGNKSDRLGEYDENELSFHDFKAVFGTSGVYQEIERLYKEKRNVLASKWELLPKGATQGDFCHYNMLFSVKGEVQGIFDFNLAGDEVFVNECVAVGVYLSWHTEFKGNYTAEERFKAYLKAYQKIRPLNSVEQTCVTPLIQIIRAFRFDRVEAGALKKESNFLKETMKLLVEKI